MSSTPLADVLYTDYHGHERPLNRMYFSDDSQCLVAADHPESVQEEVESHFCPHCNSLWQGPEAQENENRCLQCFECPCCSCVMIPAPTNLSAVSSPPTQYCLRCPYCRWSSEDLGEGENGSLVACDLPTLHRVAASATREHGQMSAFNELAAIAKQRENDCLREAERSARRRALSVSATPGVAGCGADPNRPWKIADLENALSQRAEAITCASFAVTAITSPASDKGSKSSQATSLTSIAGSTFGIRQVETSAAEHHASDTDRPDPNLWGRTQGNEERSLAVRVESRRSHTLLGRKDPNPNVVPGATADPSAAGRRTMQDPARSFSLPKRVRLRTRLGKRCKKDLAAGKTGILVKATFDPLEGDSSILKKGGNWFKKDSSASLLVPQVVVVALPSAAELAGDGDAASAETATSSWSVLREHKGSVIVRIANPQVTGIQVRLEHKETATIFEGLEAQEDSAKASRDDMVMRESAAGYTKVRSQSNDHLETSMVMSPEGFGRDGAWIKLEGREDEVLWQPGDRRYIAPPLLESPGKVGSEDAIIKRNASALHVQGDLAWAQIPLGGAKGRRRRVDVIVVRMCLLFRGDAPDESSDRGETDVAHDSETISIPISIRFKLSDCPQ